MPDDRAHWPRDARQSWKRARLMRWVICAVFVLALAPSAFAGDVGVVRAPQPTYHWGGFYGGAQVGYTSSEINFGTAGSSDVGFLLRDTAIEQDQQISQWTVLSSRSPGSAGAGGFVGYNTEWEDLILGLELNYNRVSLSASSADAITRSFTDSTNLPAGHNYFYTVTSGVAASISMHDIAELRARAGWEAGIFLPYVFGGLAVSRANVTSLGTITYSAVDNPTSEIPPLTPLPDLAGGPLAQGNVQNNLIAYGVASGVGVDMALMPNLFIRGELEYTYFAPIAGIHVTLSTARVGVGFKF
jgi:opacity protein-like surface antigen